MTELTSTTDLDRDSFVDRAQENRQRFETLYAWHMQAYLIGRVSLPYTATEDWIDVTVSHWNSETQQYDLDLEASRQAIAKVAKFVARASNAIVTKDWTDSELQLDVQVTSLDETQTYTVTYKVNREAVCEKKVVGYEDVPEYVTPAYKKEVVEWECTDVSLLKIADQ